MKALLPGSYSDTESICSFTITTVWKEEKCRWAFIQTRTIALHSWLTQLFIQLGREQQILRERGGWHRKVVIVLIYLTQSYSGHPVELCHWCLYPERPKQNQHLCLMASPVWAWSDIRLLFVTVIAGQAAIPHQGSLTKLSLLLCLWDADESHLNKVF